MGTRLLAIVVSLVVIPGPAMAGDVPSTADLERFEKAVRPLLADRCWSCHGSEKQRGGLRLDTAEGVAAGGDSGPVLVPGKPDESLLVTVITYHDDLKMPPRGKLPDAEIAEITRWVQSGAAWPGADLAKPVAAVEEPESAPPAPFWAFQPIADPLPPEVQATGWVKSPIDRFLLAKLEQNGISPAPPASKRDLIRRVTFDLVGLPPSPEEVDAFIADDSPEAFAKVVDRLLASPRYGERWGRRWLDLARYSDSNGMDENVAYANAYRYRDYVIRSFNADKPYDVFLTEQIAGDLMPAGDDVARRHERMTATGFLVLGPKMLAEDDPMKMEMDIIDEQVDTIGRVFMGLTIGCARCHDHKFDPIPTADYYAMAGIFKSTKSMANHKVVAMWNEQPLASPEEVAALDAHNAEASRRKSAIDSQIKTTREELAKDNRGRAGHYLAASLIWERSKPLRKALLESPIDETTTGAIVREAESFDRGNALIDTTNYGTGIGVILNRGEVPNVAEYDVEIAADGVYRVAIRHAAAEARPVVLKVDGEILAVAAAGAVTGSWMPDTQAWFPAGVVAMKAGRHTIRLERDGAFPHLDRVAIAPCDLPEGVKPDALASLDEIAAAKGLNPRLVERWADAVARARKSDSEWISMLQDLAGQEPSPEALGHRLQATLDRAATLDILALLNDPKTLNLELSLTGRGGPLTIPRNPEKLFPPASADALKQARESLAEFEKTAPEVSRAMSVEDEKPADLKIHIRGNHLTLGDVAPRGFPRVIPTSSSIAINPERSGRLELAGWLADPGHPLTARVMANRIWLGHFGEGLVRSPDNFGRLGEAPDHPDLLDWLASRFVESGWSIKSMHRLILLSSAYQMSTHANAEAARIDPENRLLWHRDRRRIDAESIRDAILAVSGELDTTMGGTMLPTKNHAYVNDTSARGATRYDSNRRSVYLPVIRSGLYDVFQAFDFADPSTSSGQRIPTTVAPQALFMMNDRLVLRSAEALAKRLLAIPDLDDAGRVRRLYRLAYGRSPEDREVARAAGYLRLFETDLARQNIELEARPLRSWQALCQAVLASSEFIYLD